VNHTTVRAGGRGSRRAANRVTLATIACLFLLSRTPILADDDRPTEHGVATFTPTAAEDNVAARFRLEPHTFDWQARRMQTVTDHLEVWDVTFPSPVKTPEEPNNTVHCEYYRARCPGRRPGVIVLHILGGDFPLSRLFCNALAQHGVGALFVKMPYYGPRRDPLSPRRMVSPDPRETVAGMTQAVLDIRQAAAWLAARPEIDPDRLGIFGISLGGITAALASTAEPRLKNVCLLLAGGDIGSAGWDSPEARQVRERWLTQGGTREQFLEILGPVDPVTYAPAATGKRILMLNATDDEVIPRACTLALWNAFGQPEIQWYSGGHFSVARHIFSALLRVSQFFADG
jgi:dienelactone hydrolase